METAATKLRKLAEDNAQTSAYLKQWLDLPGSEGGLVLRGVIGVIQEALTKLQSNYERLGSVTNESSSEIAKAAKMYRSTDRSFAEALDRAYAKDGGR